jgi:hypothetical protein
MRHLSIAAATTVALLLATGAFPGRAGAADVGGPPPGYGPPSVYGPPPSYGPSPGYRSSEEYGPPPGYGPSSRYSPPDDYGPLDDYGPPTDYGPPPRPPHAIPYAFSPRSYAVRPECDPQWRCGPRGCGWRQVCYPPKALPEHYARPYRGYGPPPGPGYYGPY